MAEKRIDRYGGRGWRPNLQRNLRARLLVSHLAISAVAMGVVGFSLLTLARAYFLDALETSLLVQSDLISQNLIPGANLLSEPSQSPSAFNTLQQQQLQNLSIAVENAATPQASGDEPIDSINFEALSQTTVELSSALQTQIRLFDLRGDLLLAAGVDSLSDQQIGDAVPLGPVEEVSRELLSTEAGEWMIVSAPFRVEDQLVGTLALAHPLSDMATVLNSLLTRFLLAAVLALGLTGMLAVILARGIQRPVGALTKAAQKLSEGDYDHPLPLGRQDEIGDLSRTFTLMRDRLRHIEQTRTQFISDVSHELRTPLTGIKSLIETLQDGAVEDPNVRDRFLASIENETDRLTRLANDLLTLTRADSSVLNLNPQNVDLGELVRNTCYTYSQEVEKHRVQLKLLLPMTNLVARVDPDRIEQVVVNLLDNALKHAPPSTEIQIRGTLHFRTSAETWDERSEEEPLLDSMRIKLVQLPPGTWIGFQIIDQGQGIRPQDLPHVFERFYRADEARDRDRGGSGLGLPIAKALVEAHGGRIWVESPFLQNADQSLPGTAATFVLPGQTTQAP